MANLQAQASPLPASLINFNIRVPVLVPLVLGAIILRLALASIHGFGIDIGTFRAWSFDLAHEGPWNFYQDGKFTDYAPGYMYVLLLIGKMQQLFNLNDSQFEYVLKIPSIVADIGSALLIYRMLDKQRPAVQLFATAVYLFFPCALLVGAVWGQVDSILAFFLLLTIYFIARNKPVAAAIAFSLGFLIKPQAIAALPFLAFWIIRDNPLKWDDFTAFVRYLIPPYSKGEKAPHNPLVIAECILFPLILVLLLVIPFFGNVQGHLPFFEYQPWKLFKVLYNAANVPTYRVNSFWAFNFWNTGGIFKMGFKCDLAGACGGDAKATQFLGMSTRWWSLIMLGSALASIIVVLRNARGTGYLALGTALSTMAFYMFLTRMHERYVFPAFLPLLLAAALIQSRFLWGIFVTMAAVHFLNLYQVFAYYFFFNDEQKAHFPDFLRVPKLYNFLQGKFFGANDASHKNIAERLHLPLGLPNMETLQLMSILFVTAFVVVLAWAVVRVGRRGRVLEAA
jgi:Gpi18-like mannosyltransferase